MGQIYVKAQREPWWVLFSPAAEVRRQDGFVLVKLLRNCGNSKTCSDDYIIPVCVSFSPTEQLPYLGGLYHQGQQTTVATKVCLCMSMHVFYAIVPKQRLKCQRRKHQKVKITLDCFYNWLRWKIGLSVKATFYRLYNPREWIHH